MKALTIHQPYAELIASGDKRVENRTWATSYRGPLAIHAGKSEEWFTGRIPGERNFPRGAIVAVADMIDCLDIAAACSFPVGHELRWVAEHEHTNGPFCFVLANVRQLDKPLYMAGKQGLWKIDDSLILPRIAQEVTT